VRRDYELGFILSPEVSDEQTRAILDRVEQVVANNGGQIVRVNQWGRRRLGYPIERHRDGFYVFIDMILTPENVIELDRTLKVSEEVLRHLIKRRDPKAVQKEREAHATAAAAAAAPAVPAAEAEPQDEMQTPGEDEIAGEEAEIPSDLSTGDVEDEDIPAAIEEPSEA
jgi:small subunit ribosomal protein S6